MVTCSVKRYSTQVQQLRQETPLQCSVEMPEADATRVEPLKGVSGIRMQESEPNPNSSSLRKERLEEVHHQNEAKREASP